MKIEAVSTIHFPLETVFQAHRDQLPELARYIPDIRSIEVQSREEQGALVKLHNIWHADQEIPAFARKFIKPEMLLWDDFADWNESDKTCSWRIKTRFFSDAVRCQGRNTFRAQGADRCEVRIDGDLHIDLKKIPGVPKLLARTLGPQIERFVVALIRPNLIKVNDALVRYLSEK